MNCEEYRHRIAADPSFDGGAGHLSECQQCQAFRNEMRSLDGKIAKAMQIDVPTFSLPELPAIDAENVVPLATRKLHARPAWFALAATVLLAVVIGVRMSGVGVSYESLADEVLAHLVNVRKKCR